MDFTILNDYIVFVVLLACLIVGYLIKTSLDFIPNKYIPSILAIVGIVLNCAYSGIGLENAIFGALNGLMAVGLHQTFKQFIERNE